MKFLTLFTGFFAALTVSDMINNNNDNLGDQGMSPEEYAEWVKTPEVVALHKYLKDNPYPTIPMKPKP